MSTAGGAELVHQAVGALDDVPLPASPRPDGGIATLLAGHAKDTPGQRALLAIEVVDDGRHRHRLPVAAGGHIAGCGAQPIEAEEGADAEEHVGDFSHRALGLGRREHHVGRGPQRFEAGHAAGNGGGGAFAGAARLAFLERFGFEFAQQPRQAALQFGDALGVPRDHRRDVDRPALVIQEP